MSPTTWFSASSATPRVPSPTLHRHRTWTLTTLHSASCSPRHTEDKPITAIQKACQSVSRRLLCSMGSGKPDGERMVDQSGKSDVTFNVISAHSNFSEDIQIERMVDRSGKIEERQQLKCHRLGPYLMNRDK